LINLRI